jgi:hypothetical protein
LGYNKEIKKIKFHFYKQITEKIYSLLILVGESIDNIYVIFWQMTPLFSPLISSSFFLFCRRQHRTPTYFVTNQAIIITNLVTPPSLSAILFWFNFFWIFTTSSNKTTRFFCWNLFLKYWFFFLHFDVVYVIHLCVYLFYSVFP